MGEKVADHHIYKAKLEYILYFWLAIKSELESQPLGAKAQWCSILKGKAHNSIRLRAAVGVSATFVLAEHSSYFRHNMTTNFDLYPFQLF